MIIHFATGIWCDWLCDLSVFVGFSPPRDFRDRLSSYAHDFLVIGMGFCCCFYIKYLDFQPLWSLYFSLF